ncbi:MAG: elongation factor P--(R)-beta-lysine ligase [Halioglobus sp.]
MLNQIRAFFLERDVLEVETPLLAAAGVTDPAIEPFCVPHGVSLPAPRFLQTSPEYAMKRLLSAHGQAIYQVCKAFRDGEAGARHNPEFTLLEWYRPGLDHHALMEEVAELVCSVLGDRPHRSISYRQVFLQQLSVDPMRATSQELAQVARQHLDPGDLEGGRDLWLDLLMSHVIEPWLADQGMCFVYDYPSSQAALARIVPAGDVSVGQRFELYVDGLELANGYYELADAAEQRSRFDADNAHRRECGLAERAADEQLLAALEQGLPDCSGVALGLDRLLMLALGETDIRAVLAFDWDNA